MVHPLCVTQPSLHTLLLVRTARETFELRAALTGQFMKPFPPVCMLVPVCRQRGQPLSGEFKQDNWRKSLPSLQIAVSERAPAKYDLSSVKNVCV